MSPIIYFLEMIQELCKRHEGNLGHDRKFKWSVLKHLLVNPSEFSPSIFLRSANIRRKTAKTCLVLHKYAYCIISIETIEQSLWVLVTLLISTDYHYSSTSRGSCSRNLMNIIKGVFSSIPYRQDNHLISFKKKKSSFKIRMCLLCMIGEFGHNWWIYNCLINRAKEQRESCVKAST